ncbi:MAG: galactose mutarotase [Oscillospiraceae bacterium]|nr:galactose mutarotase [Oscillospiraceae bacterium]
METFKISNQAGIAAEISATGASVLSLTLPDSSGGFTDVVLAHREQDKYLSNPDCFGSIVGRNANRIRSAKFSLDGKTYLLEKNAGKHNIHGGSRGFTVREFSLLKKTVNSVTLQNTIPDMEDGFPGTVFLAVTYTITERNALSIEYNAHSSRKTILNLTNHTYFNLSGHASGSLDTHLFRLNSGFYFPSDSSLIPTGELLSVHGTQFDFRKFAPLTEARYDNCFALNGSGFRKIADVREQTSGRSMTVCTDLPAVQLYNACNLMPGTPGKDGAVYNPGCGFCLETQYVPNAVNMPWLAQPVGTDFVSKTVFEFNMP